MIHCADSTIALEVDELLGDTIQVISHSDGELLNNKGMHVPGIHKDIPFLFERDQKLIESACELGLDYLSLSFVRNAEDIRTAKQLITSKVQIFAKVETTDAVNNLSEILNEVDTINIDRGDLSSDIGMYELPEAQEMIIREAKTAGKQIFLATQFLKNMEFHPVPLIPEIIELHKSIRVGVSGIQLSEETAVGKYPVECVKTYIRCLQPLPAQPARLSPSAN